MEWDVWAAQHGLPKQMSSLPLPRLPMLPMPPRAESSWKQALMKSLAVNVKKSVQSNSLATFELELHRHLCC